MDAAAVLVGSLPLDVERAVASAAWDAARFTRRVSFHNNNTCPTIRAPYSDEDPEGRLVKQACFDAGCLDWHHDLISNTRAKLQQLCAKKPIQEIHHLDAYCRKIAEREQIELGRKQRTANHLPAKPHRTDGAAARLIAFLKTNYGQQSKWLIDVFRILRVYVTMPNRTGTSWPLDWLAEELRASGHDFVVNEHQLKEHISCVLRHAKEILGQAWVYDNLIGPLNAGLPAKSVSEQIRSPQSAPEDIILAQDLSASYLGYLNQGYSTEQALRAAAQQVCGIDFKDINKEVRSILRELG